MMRQYVRDRLTEVDMYLLLAEEAAELSQAAAKTARVIMGNNPSPKSVDECVSNVIEEMSDVVSVCRVMFESTRNAEVERTIHRKLQRWVSRIYQSGLTSTDDNVQVEKVMYGKSDGLPWYVVDIVPDSYPYTVKATRVDNDGNKVTKELKPEWLTDVRPSVTSLDKKVTHVGDVVYYQYRPVKLLVEKIIADSVVVRVCSTKATLTLPCTSITKSFSDNEAYINEDFKTFLKTGPEKYCHFYGLDTLEGDEDEMNRFVASNLKWRYSNLLVKMHSSKETEE